MTRPGPIRLLLGANDAYAMPLAVTAHSALVRLPRDREVEVHLIDGGFTPENRSRIGRTLARAHPRVRMVWHGIDFARLAGIDTRRYSPVSTTRLLAADLFPPEAERVLYLDSDLVVEDDLSPLWDLAPGDRPFLAVQNGPDADFDRLVRAKFPDLAFPEGARYCNSGVLLIHLPEWRRQRIGERALEFLRSHPGLSFPDQDALNAVAAGAWGALDRRWNRQAIAIGSPDAAPPGARGILHFTSVKPWTPTFDRRGGATFLRAYLRSGWDGPATAWPRAAWLFLRQTLRRVRRGLHRRLGPRAGAPA